MIRPFPFSTGPIMTVEPVSVSPVSQPAVPQSRSRLRRLICSQNPFYLLSVCFVLHASAQWFHSDSGESFSPWPLLGLTVGYIALLAVTGFVIVRFGKVWDDARSILLLILLLFVEMSLIFDETLVREPDTGRRLLIAGLIFSMVLSEILLLGLKIRLPWLFRVPYHLLLGLLFLYPLLLAGKNTLQMQTVSWLILAFPTVAGGILLTLLPAIRRGPKYTQDNGTPWRWPWYPWSLFVFLAFCIAFRTYAISLSFDPVFGESLTAALSFESTFGLYFLIPLVFAVGLLLMEAGLVSKHDGAIRLALWVPMICLVMALPPASASGTYQAFALRVTEQVGSPIWLTLLLSAAFYGYAMVRRVVTANVLMAWSLIAASRISPQMLNVTLSTQPIIWPLVLLAVIEFARGIQRGNSREVFVSLMIVIAALQPWLQPMGQTNTRSLLIVGGLVTIALLGTGAAFRDDFAWLLRIVGGPLLLLVTMAGAVLSHGAGSLSAIWYTVAVVAITTVIAFAYGAAVQMRLYQLCGWTSGLLGTLVIIVEAVSLLLHESGWRGATSFSVGIGWFVVAVVISCWKAGWLRSLGPWFGGMLTSRSERLDLNFY
ncbi:MAG: hypothetical protein JWP89_2375 [Schlesneria sp.]|nr:hypothetical protein [Schlesneria sp.]